MKPTTKRTGLPAASLTTIGDTGLKRYGGFINEEFLPALKGQRGMRTYREMADNDPTVGAVLFALNTLVRQCEWTVQAVDDSPEAEEAKTFLEEVLADMNAPMSAIVSEIASMFTYGFAPMEVTWKRRSGPSADRKLASRYDDGRIGVRSIALRSQNTVARWIFDDEDGAAIAMVQQPWSGTERTIPLEKLLLFRTTAERNNPEGRSVLRTAYRPFFFKKKIEEIEAIGVERDLAGLPVARIPAQFFDPSGSPDDKRILAEWQKLVTTIRRDQREGIVLPSARDQSGNLLYDLELLSAGGSRAIDTSKIVDRYYRAIATSVLADFIFLGQQAVGSFALSSDKTALFAAAVGAFTTSIEDTFNRDFVTKLWDYNALDPDYMPQMRMGDVETQNLAEVAEFLGSLTGAGLQLFPDRDLENHLRTLAGFPEAPEEGDETAGEIDAAVEAEMARQAQEREAARAAAQTKPPAPGAQERETEE